MAQMQVPPRPTSCTSVDDSFQPNSAPYHVDQAQGSLHLEWWALVLCQGWGIIQTSQSHLPAGIQRHHTHLIPQSLFLIDTLWLCSLCPQMQSPCGPTWQAVFSSPRLSVYSKSPLFAPSSCKRSSKMPTCVHMSNHIRSE